MLENTFMIYDFNISALKLQKEHFEILVVYMILK